MSDERGSVKLTDVTKRFGTMVAVDRLSLDVRPGEFLSLLGPSGCGKTTTLRMLAGFEQPDEGVISISGQHVQGVPPYKRDVNTVFQHYSLFPHMTVAENVAYGLRQKGFEKSQINRQVGEVLDMVKMTKLAKRKPKQMSGGQQQRVALARALVNRPSVLLLDEPLGALDRKLRQEMQIELKLLQREVGITFVFVTHDQEEALSMSDRIAVMLEGHIEQLADADTIYDQPISAFVAGFIGQNNFFRGTATGNDGEVSCEGMYVHGVMRESIDHHETALVTVRPEAMSMTATMPDQQFNVATGKLAGVSPLGDVIQFVVRASGRDVLVRTPRHSAPKFDVGQTVFVSWPAELAQIFSAKQSNLVMADPAADSSH